jgi:hypothetical protein
VLIVETVEEHRRVRLSDEDDEVKKVVEAVPWNNEQLYPNR